MNTIYRYSLITRIKEPLIDELLALRTDDRFLDAGCGAGYFVQKYSRTGHKVYGFDIVVNALRPLREAGRVRVTAASALQTPFQDASFDKILFSDVIEHLEHDDLAVRELVRILKPGGALVVTTPALEGPLTGRRLNRLYHDVQGTPEYHVRPGYRAEGLAELLSREGLLVERTEYGDFFFSELTVELLKLAVYVLNRRKVSFESQDDARKLTEGKVFPLYRYIVFPPLLALCRVEQALLRGCRRGHTLIVLARKRA